MVGLKGVEYMDSLQDKKRLKEQGDSITFIEELDRIYLQTPDTLEVRLFSVLVLHSTVPAKQSAACHHDEVICFSESMVQMTHPSLHMQVVDEGKNRAVQIEKEGFPDAVVWNPWIKKAVGMADFGDEEYKVGGLDQHSLLSHNIFTHPTLAR